MKITMTTAFALAAIGAISASAIAGDRPSTKGPPWTMGEEGKLPASETMRNATPDMTGPNSAATGESSGASGSAQPGQLRMGDEPGKLPATGTVSGKVPEMRGPVPGEK